MSYKPYDNPPPPRPNIIRISKVAPLPPAFAVEGILPICALSCILATPGAGKTTLATMLAAATHPPYYQESDDPTVLMVSAFTDAQFEIRPKLGQLGTNLDRVRVMDHLYLPDARSNPRRAYTIHDLPTINAELTRYPSYRLLIIDCAEMFLDLPSRPNRKKALEQLYSLVDLANLHEISILLIFTTSQLRENPFASTLLSAVAEASRTSYILDRDSAGQRTLYPYKNVLNFMAKNYLIANLPTVNDPAHTYPPGTCAPSPDADTSSPESKIKNQNSKIESEAQTVLRNRALFIEHPDQLPFASRRAKERQKPGPEPYARDFACEVLLDALKKGPKPVGDKNDPQPRTLMYDLELANITFGTAMRAKCHLNIEAYKKGKKWYWRLTPPQPARTTPSTSCAPSPSVSKDHPSQISDSPPTICASSSPQSQIENRQSEISTTPSTTCTSSSPLSNPASSRETSPQSQIENRQSAIPTDSQPGQSEGQSPPLLLSAKTA